MLDFVRTKQKSIIIKLVFGLIILSFVIGYAMLTSPGDGTKAEQQSVAVTVNGKELGTHRGGLPGLRNYQNQKRYPTVTGLLVLINQKHAPWECPGFEGPFSDSPLIILLFCCP